VELQAARSVYGRYYRLPNGRKAAMISSASIHYKTLNGTYELVDNSIVSSPSHDGYAFCNAANSFSVYFPDKANHTTDILFQSQTHTEIHLWNQGEIWYESPVNGRELLHQADVSTGMPEENAIQYPERYPGIKEIFTVRYEGIKHSYEISQIPSFLNGYTDGTIEFQEVVVLPTGTRLSVDGKPQPHDFITDHDIHLLDANGNILGVFPTPWAHEGTSKGFDPEVDAELRLSYRVTQLGAGRVKIAVQVPLDWMTEPDRTYPITIDPSYYYDENHSYDDCFHFIFSITKQVCSKKHLTNPKQGCERIQQRQD